jgi:hypothetical protein
MNFKTRNPPITESLATDRLWILASLGLSIATAIVLLYTTVNRGRIDVVYLSDDKFDAPTLLDKVATDRDVMRADRYVRGMIRRFVTNFWVTPDMTADEARDALRWTIAHTSKGGQLRGAAILQDFKNFEDKRRQKWSAFKPLIDDQSVTIKRSGITGDRYHITVPGTYVSVTADGEHYASAVLRLIMKDVGVSGVPRAEAADVINVTGLEIAAASVSLQNGSDAPTTISLFAD